MTFNIQPLVPELWCSDFARSMTFYTGILGFEIAQQRGRDPHAYLSCGGAQIMIAHWAFDGSWEPWYSKPMEPPFGRGVNFQFMIDDVQGLYDRIVSADETPFLDIHDVEIWKTDCMDTRRQFMVLDPDGYVLRFAQSLRTRPLAPKDQRNLDEQYDAGPQ